jgi:histone deacetylase complex subunit SAP18
MSSTSKPPQIDRHTTTPFLLKFCYRSGGFHNLSDFPIPTPSNPNPHLPSHLQIYTWPSCTLRELAHLLTGALPNILPDPAVGTRLSFRLVYPDTRPPPGGGRLDDARGRYMSKEMGSIVVAPEEDGHVNGEGRAAGRVNVGGDDAEKTLADARFVIGDFVDCAVFPPLADGSVAPGTSATYGARTASYGGGPRGGGGPPLAENGYGRPRGGGFIGGGGRGGLGGGRGDFGRDGTIPSGEWRRGEKLPDSGYRGYGGGRGRGRGGY